MMFRYFDQAIDSKQRYLCKASIKLYYFKGRFSATPVPLMCNPGPYREGVGVIADPSGGPTRRDVLVACQHLERILKPPAGIDVGPPGHSKT